MHHPFTPAVSQQLILPQNEQLATFAQAADQPEDTVDYINATGISVTNDVSEPVSLQASDDEVEEVATERAMDFVACHGASPALADNVNDSSSTLAEIFRCFICLGKVNLIFVFTYSDVQVLEVSDSTKLRRVPLFASSRLFCKFNAKQGHQGTA